MTFNDEIIGFCCCMITYNPKELKIDKFVLHYNPHQKVYGAMLMAEVINIMRENNLQSLMLTVNKQNHTAISAYRGTKQLAINL